MPSTISHQPRMVRSRPCLTLSPAVDCARPPSRQYRTAAEAWPQGLRCHAISCRNILRLHGESALRGKLEQVRTVEDLRAVALASGLVLAGKAGGARPSPHRYDPRH